MTNKNILITGATSGIGLDIAKSLYEKFAFINLSRTMPKSSDQNKFLKSVKLNLQTNEQNIKDALIKLKDDGYTFDGVVACAGMQKISPITGINEKDLFEIFQLNLFANLFLLKNMLRIGIMSNGASVIFISSISSERPDSGIGAYSMSKAALDNFVKVAAIEFSNKGIRVNSIRPGLIKTKMTSNQVAYSDEFLLSEKMKYKLGEGKPEYVTKLVEFLLSNDSSWITGQNITIDGGRNLHQ